MTETNMILSNPYKGERRAGFVGLPLPGVEVRIVPEDSAEGGTEDLQDSGDMPAITTSIGCFMETAAHANQEFHSPTASTWLDHALHTWVSDAKPALPKLSVCGSDVRQRTGHASSQSSKVCP